MPGPARHSLWRRDRRRRRVVTSSVESAERRKASRTRRSVSLDRRLAFSRRRHPGHRGTCNEGIGRGLMPMIAGGGPLADRVVFLGTVRGSRTGLLQRSDVFVLPSADESFGIAVAEAMAVGCPVVVSPEVAIEDVVRTSGAGLVVEREPPAIANAIATILSEPTRAAAMGEAGRRAVDDRFSWPVVAAETEAMYEAVVGARSRRVDGRPPSRRPRRRLSFGRTRVSMPALPQRDHARPVHRQMELRGLWLDRLGQRAAFRSSFHSRQWPSTTNWITARMDTKRPNLSTSTGPGRRHSRSIGHTARRACTASCSRRSFVVPWVPSVHIS